ncbi:MAG: ATP-dependent Clp protease ATP-binding subunit [Planctomycetes bacterium]|nr:ATP-dependent Clp protease ATP-binding subunit [Planctomycetota bacterium]
MKLDARDRDTLILYGVPVSAQYSKSHVNLLVKRSREKLFFCFADQDLAYQGQDPAICRLFGGEGVKREGWRCLFADHSDRTFQGAVERALSILGFLAEPRLPPPNVHAQGGCQLLNAFARDLSGEIREGMAEPTVGREKTVAEVTMCLRRMGGAKLVIVAGPPGVGKTNLCSAVAARLAECCPTLAMWSVDLGLLFAGTLFDAEREGLLMNLLSETIENNGTGLVLAMEHLELTLRSPCGPDILTHALNSNARIVGVTTAEHLRHIPPALARRAHVIELAGLSPTQTLGVLRAHAERLAKHHGVQIPDACLPACVKAVQELPGNLPAKALLILDTAAANVALSSAGVVSVDDIYFAARLCEKSAERLP